MIEITPEILMGIARPYKTVRSKREGQRINVYALPHHMNIWFPVYEVTSKLRVAHFLAQSCCETAYFLSMTELPKNKGLEYEPTTNAGRMVGNHFPGDGPRFIGRGLLHLTGRENYQKYGNKIHEDLVNHPEKVASDLSLAVRTSCIFWQTMGLNDLADRNNFDEICRRVNGGVNGKEQRREALVRAKRLLGLQ